MSSTSAAPNAQGRSIILFHYPFSPYARRVIWFLTLRGIPYAQCLQPPTLPRPTIAALGVKYRRIPICAIDGEIYADTRLILRKLESMFPSSTFSGTTTPENAAVTRLLERFTTDVLFPRAAQLIPVSLPVMKDEKFLRDRTEFSGRPWSAEVQAKGRPEALVHMRDSMRLLESTFLSDGRKWALGGESPTMADLQAVWIFDWLAGMPGALDVDSMGERAFPYIYALVKRWNTALKEAKTSAPKPVTMKGEQAIESVLRGPRTSDMVVDPNDPLKLSKGDHIQLWPIDSGFGHKDSGELVGLNEDEVVLSIKSENGTGVLLHVPRWGFRVVKADGAKL